MNAETLAKLDAIKYHSTRYELTISHPDGRRYLVAYTPRKNRAGIFDAISEATRGPWLVAKTGDQDIHFAKRVADGATMGEWTINFTGRTQRDCVLGTGGPALTYILDVPA